MNSSPASFSSSSPHSADQPAAAAAAPPAVPDQCTAAVFTGPGRPLELWSLPVPQPEPGEALVRIECCTVCGSDLHTIRGRRVERTPSILGHEATGVVAAVGTPPLTDTTGRPLQPGERVTWSSSVSCGSCDRCLAGLPQKCRTLAKYGHETTEGRLALSGGLAEFILLRRGSAVVPVAPQLPAELVSPVNCATATIAAACRRAGRLEGKRVLITGAGMLGLTAAAWAKSAAAAHVTVCDPRSDRRERARLFGADVAAERVERPAGEGRPTASLSVDGTCDVAFELSGDPEAVAAVIEQGAVGSQIVLVGTVMPSPPVSIDPERVVRRCQSIHGVHNYAAEDLAAAVRFLETHAATWPFRDLVSQRRPLREINDAVEHALASQPVRMAICP